MTRKTLWLSCVILLLLTSIAILIGCQKPQQTAGFQPEILPLPPQLTSYEAMPIPPDNPMTPEKVALGRQLFFDERLSGDGSRSCYSCHVCEKGLTDGLAKSVGAFNKQLPRSSPTLWNIGYHKEFYWDGRSPSLEKQAMAAWTGANMGAKADEIAAKLNGLQGYRRSFRKCSALMRRRTILSKRSLLSSGRLSAAIPRGIVIARETNRRLAPVRCAAGISFRRSNALTATTAFY